MVDAALQGVANAANTVIAGAGHRKAIDDINRLVATYGGNAGDWVKASTPSRVLEQGRSIAVHFYQNVVTGQIVELKTKLGN